MTEPDAAPGPSHGAEDTWRERAVERSLLDARAKAVDRSDRFLQAATSLLAESGTPDFTVQQLVERTRMSLRSFYQHFGSKDELLLMLFQEALRTAVSEWEQDIAPLEGAVAKVRAVVGHIYGQSGARGAEEQRSMRALATYHLQLADRRPADFAIVVAPLKALLLAIVAEGVESGEFRSDLGVEPLTVLVMQSLMVTTIFRLLHDELMATPLGPEQLFQFIAGGLGAEAGGGEPSRRVLRRRRG